jgi:hemerythrin-like domain-containing protein
LQGKVNNWEGDVMERNDGRRAFLRAAGTGAVALIGCATVGATRGDGGGAPKSERDEVEVSPGEDLMQEHALLERILQVYDEAARRIERGTAVDTGVVTKAARVVRRFVEDYHEKLEQDFVFPRLDKAHREVELVSVLLKQHERGRQLTDEIIRRAQAGAGVELAAALKSFAQMYRPHAAREGTVLFPAFREVVGGAAYRELGEQFEDREHELFGKGGFARTVGEVQALELALGIGNLDRFTPA